MEKKPVLFQKDVSQEQDWRSQYEEINWKDNYFVTKKGERKPIWVENEEFRKKRSTNT